MSTIRIQLLMPVQISKPNASKNYQQMVVTHQELGKDKPDGKKIFDFTTPKEVWETLKNAPAMSYWEVDRQKDAKEGKYWEWKAIRPVDPATQAIPAAQPSTAVPSVATGSAASSTGARVGNWETPEERGKKQVYIVRQSSISSAIEYLHKFRDDMPEVGINDVIETARRFEDYVFGKGFADMTDDQPE